MKNITNLLFVCLLLFSLASCAGAPDQITADVSKISEPVKVSRIGFQIGPDYFTTDDAAIEGFCEFYTNQIDSILTTFTERTGVVLDIGSFKESLKDLTNISVSDGSRTKLVDWNTEKPDNDIWSRMYVIFGDGAILVDMYILEPGKDIVYGVSTKPTEQIWLGSETKPRQW
ncbi:hypothetical protein [Breznakiella homolactica]|uniref:Uncharacterized protein n=1 Tax=Breznakiella homolactica TaxID=2798577 RepID=A0A7T8BCF0_9SPIR|nr:hypothetical protein [Breznakiella homolactica]QQO10188.1 hypothetical protein JFL75_04505 [Breznakiella homolactica]